MQSPKKSKPSVEEHTVGEELYLVHLQRSSEEAEEDYDLPHPRKLNRTIGEELFNIHLKRSEGVDPDYDVEDYGVKEEVKKTECAYGLRSKDKQVKLAGEGK